MRGEHGCETCDEGSHYGSEDGVTCCCCGRREDGQEMCGALMFSGSTCQKPTGHDGHHHRYSPADPEEDDL